MASVLTPGGHLAPIPARWHLLHCASAGGARARGPVAGNVVQMNFSEALRSAAENPDVVAGDERTRELALRLAEVHERIDRALEASGRRERPELIVVTKNFPAEDVERLYRLGVRDVGENKDQEAAQKAWDVHDLADDDHRDRLRWHFVGQLQSNKAKSVVRYADSVHSVDRLSLVKALGKAMAREPEDAAPRSAVRPLECLIQVSLEVPASRAEPAESSGEAGRGGTSAEQMMTLAEAIDQTSGLELGGLMAVAPLHGSAREAFSRLSELSQALRQQYPQAAEISAGMSGDLEDAVASGATRLRIGRDVLGDRSAAR